MIRPLRARHRLMFVLISVGLVAGIAAGLAGRRDEPVSPLPARLAPPAATGAVVAQTEITVADTRVAVRLRAGGQLELQAAEDLARPDVLVAWSAPGTEQVVTLGALYGTRPLVYALPPSAHGGGGELRLSSLAHGEELARAPLPEANR